MENTINLIEAKEKALKQIEIWTQRLNAIELLIAQDNWNETYEIVADIDQDTISDAVRKIFEKEPVRQFSASQIKSKIRRLKEIGKINSDTKDINGSTQQALKSLTKMGYITRTAVMGGNRYQKK